MSDHVDYDSDCQRENAAFELGDCQQVYLGYPHPGEAGDLALASLVARSFHPVSGVEF